MDTHQLKYTKEENTLRSCREQYLLKTYILQYIPYPVYTRHFPPAAHGLARLVYKNGTDETVQADVKEFKTVYLSTVK